MNLKKYSKQCLIVIATIVVVIVVILACRGCDIGNEPTQPTVGDVDISDTRPTVNPSTPTGEIQNITFVGRAKYVVSANNPKIEVRNSEKNQELGVEFVFTIIDAKTNTVIARTPKVKPGQYAYINMMDYYQTPGSYDIIVSIRVTDSNGNELNGMDQEAVLYVV